MWNRNALKNRRMNNSITVNFENINKKISEEFNLNCRNETAYCLKVANSFYGILVAIQLWRFSKKEVPRVKSCF